MLAVVTLIQTPWSKILSVIVFTVWTNKALWPSKFEKEIATLIIRAESLLKLQSIHFIDIHG
jgi:hypothetical protein